MVLHDHDKPGEKKNPPICQIGGFALVVLSLLPISFEPIEVPAAEPAWRISGFFRADFPSGCDLHHRECIFVSTENVTMTTLFAAEAKRGCSCHGLPVFNLSISDIGCNGDD